MAITITVSDVTPIVLIGELIQYIQGLGIHIGTENSLTAKLDNAVKSLEKGQTSAAINQVGAFINEVEAQSGKKITIEQAQVMIGRAQVIIYVIGL